MYMYIYAYTIHIHVNIYKYRRQNQQQVNRLPTQQVTGTWLVWVHQPKTWLKSKDFTSGNVSSL